MLVTIGWIVFLAPLVWVLWYIWRELDFNPEELLAVVLIVVGLALWVALGVWLTVYS